MNDADNKKREARGFKREDGQPKNGPSDDLAGRISGLEKAKTYEGMTRQDIAALDKVIDKLKAKLAESKGQNQEV